MTFIATSQFLYIGTNLVPFLITTCLYFIVLFPYDQPSILALAVKCSPILSLMYFVGSVGFQNGYTYSTRIFTGLMFCCIGDGCLLYPNFFLFGMIAFMFGHLHYIWAFGFYPLNLKLGIVIFFLGGIAMAILYRGLRGVYAVGVPIYILIIITMIWRAIARIKYPWTWIQLCTCLGSILFAFSDSVIGLDLFVRPIAHSQILIMSSYYAAQLGIALSVAEVTY